MMKVENMCKNLNSLYGEDVPVDIFVFFSLFFFEISRPVSLSVSNRFLAPSLDFKL